MGKAVLSCEGTGSVALHQQGLYCFTVEMRTLRLPGGPHSRSQAGKWQHWIQTLGGLSSQGLSTGFLVPCASLVP